MGVREGGFNTRQGSVKSGWGRRFRFSFGFRVDGVPAQQQHTVTMGTGKK